jgi:uncharacterized protein (TIGR04255 family)
MNCRSGSQTLAPSVGILGRQMVHPSYPNPTIAEALCEVHFELREGAEWKPSLPGEFFKRIQDDYPEMEPIQEVGVQFDAGPSGFAQRILPIRPRFRYKHKDKPVLIQLAEKTITLNVLPPYPGWEVMVDRIADIWRRASELLVPGRVSRIGLRFINRVPRESEDQRPSEWFKTTDYIAPAVLRSEAGLLSRLEARLDAENRVIVTLGDQAASPSEARGAFILDIDRMVEKDLSVEVQDVTAEAVRLHEDVWDIFASAKTEKLELLLQGRAS